MSEGADFSEQVGRCTCPIHRNGDPPTLPLGISFADRVSVHGISQHVAAGICAAHHSYRDTMPEMNLFHHGLFFDGHLMGCVTYRFPLIRCINWNDVEARPSVEGDDPTAVTQLSGGRIVEVARICVGVDMPNLASAGFARSQDKFVHDYAISNGIRVLLTFVRDGYEGSMIAALADRGWLTDGVRKGKQAGNRRELEIRNADKTRWFYAVPQPDHHQATIQSAVAIADGGSNE